MPQQEGDSYKNEMNALTRRRAAHLLICFVVVRGVSSGWAERQRGDVVAACKTRGFNSEQLGY